MIENDKGEQLFSRQLDQTIYFDTETDDSIRLSEDGRIVSFKYATGSHQRRLLFDARRLVLLGPRRVQVSKEVFFNTDTRSCPFTMRIKNGKRIVKLSLPDNDFKIIKCKNLGATQPTTAASSPSGDQLAIGYLSGLCRVSCLDGKQLGNTVRTIGKVSAINWSRSGKFIVTGQVDGTIRWYDNDLKEKLTLFVSDIETAYPHLKEVKKPPPKWIAWTPKGFYYASAGGNELMAWQVNRGWDQRPDIYPASRFRKLLERPDLVIKSLDVTSDKLPNKPGLLKNSKNLPPIAEILALSSEDISGDILLKYKMRRVHEPKLVELRFLLNGQQVRSKYIKEITRDITGNGEVFGLIKLRLSGQTGYLTVLPISQNIGPGLSDTRMISAISNEAKNPREIRLRPTLCRRIFGLFVGINDYRDPHIQKLAVARRDAASLATLFSDSDIVP